MKAIYRQLEPQSIRDIQVFLQFANFYCQFIQEFSKLAISLLKITLIKSLENKNLKQTSKVEH